MPERDVVCVLTDMDQPLGNAVGNALEVREAAATLRGEGPEDLTELALDASAHLLALSDLDIDQAGGRRAYRGGGRRRLGVSRCTSAGCARRAATRAMRRCRRRRSCGKCSRRRRVTSARSGRCRSGSRPLHLGAGRQDKDDAVDHAVGVVCLKKRGDAVEAGEPLAEIHARDEATADEAAADVLAALRARRRAAAPAVDRPRHHRLTRPDRHVCTGTETCPRRACRSQVPRRVFASHVGCQAPRRGPCSTV